MAQTQKTTNTKLSLNLGKYRRVHSLVAVCRPRTHASSTIDPLHTCRKLRVSLARCHKSLLSITTQHRAWLAATCYLSLAVVWPRGWGRLHLSNWTGYGKSLLLLVKPQHNKDQWLWLPACQVEQTGADSTRLDDKAKAAQATCRFAWNADIAVEIEHENKHVGREALTKNSFGHFPDRCPTPICFKDFPNTILKKLWH